MGNKTSSRDYDLQEIANLEHDPSLHLKKVMPYGWDGSSAIALPVDSSGNLKIDPTNLDTRFLLLDQTAPQTVINGMPTFSGGITVNGGAVFNEVGAATNFRIESDGLDDIFFIDGTNNRRGFGTDAPAVEHHVSMAGFDMRWQRSSGQPNTFNWGMTNSGGTGANGSLFLRNGGTVANIAFAAAVNGTAQFIINGSQQNTVLAANTGTGLNQGCGVGAAHDFTDSRFLVVGHKTTIPVAILRAPAAHNNNILEYQKSDGTVYGSVNSIGVIGTVNKAVTLAAGVTTFAVTSNTMTITGDGGGNTVATITAGVNGQLLTLIFVDALVTITDTAAATANTVNLSAAFTSAANTTLQLVFDGNKWFEISRSIN